MDGGGIDYRNALDLSVTARAAGLRVFVAGASAELPRVRRAMCEARALLGPDAIPRDWTPDVIAARVLGLSDEDLTEDEEWRIAIKNAVGIEICHVLWLLSSRKGIGFAVELGVAIGLRMRGALPYIVVSGPERRFTISTSLADVRVETDRGALVAIARFARDRVLAEQAAEAELAEREAWRWKGRA